MTTLGVVSVTISSFVALLNIVLLAFMSKSRGTSSTYFKGTLFATLGWTLSIVLTEMDPDPVRVVFWSRLSFFFPIFTFITLQGFAASFRKSAESWFRELTLSWKIAIAAAWLTGIALAVLSVATPLILRDVINLTSSFGPLQSFYGLYVAASFLAIILLIHQARRKAHDPKERGQLKVMFWGCVISIAFGFTTNFALPYLNLGEFRFFGPLSVSYFLTATTYAILAYHLFDIRLVISRAIIYSTILGITMAVYGGTLLLLSNLFDAGASRNLITSLITALFLGFSFEPIRTWISEKTDNWLYKKEYEQQEVTKLLSEKLSTALGLDEGLDVVMQTLADTLHLDKAVTYVFQNAEVGKRAVKRSRQIGYSDPRQLELSDKDFLVQFFTQHQDILSLEELERQLEEEASMIAKDHKSKGSFRLSSDFLRDHAVKQAILRKLKELDAAVAVPLHLQV